MLQLYPSRLRPLFRSSAGTSPCNPVSGIDPGPHSARLAAVEATPGFSWIEPGAVAGSAEATHTGRTVIKVTSAMADLVLMVVNDFIESNSRCGIAFRISRADVSHGQAARRAGACSSAHDDRVGV